MTAKHSKLNRDKTNLKFHHWKVVGFVTCAWRQHVNSDEMLRGGGGGGGSGDEVSFIIQIVASSTSTAADWRATRKSASRTKIKTPTGFPCVLTGRHVRRYALGRINRVKLARTNIGPTIGPTLDWYDSDRHFGGRSTPLIAIRWAICKWAIPMAGGRSTVDLGLTLIRPWPNLELDDGKMNGGKKQVANGNGASVRKIPIEFYRRWLPVCSRALFFFLFFSFFFFFFLLFLFFYFWLLLFVVLFCFPAFVFLLLLFRLLSAAR